MHKTSWYKRYTIGGVGVRGYRPLHKKKSDTNVICVTLLIPPKSYLEGEYICALLFGSQNYWVRSSDIHRIFGLYSDPNIGRIYGEYPKKGRILPYPDPNVRRIRNSPYIRIPKFLGHIRPIFGSEYRPNIRILGEYDIRPIFGSEYSRTILATKKVANYKKTPKIRQYYLVAKFLVQLYRRILPYSDP